MIRNVKPGDFSAIARIHAEMGMDYRLPELEHPLFFVRKVAETSEGVSAACFLRLSAECYLWLDPSLSPREKMSTMLELQPAVLSEAYFKGIDDIEARLPETIERRFKKRLTQLGWTPNRNGWHPWTVRTHA